MARRTRPGRRSIASSTRCSPSAATAARLWSRSAAASSAISPASPRRATCAAIAYVQVPTTLLAQVDSSVGGKTAINHPAGKNMIGAFHQPRWSSPTSTSLQTLPRRELVAGLAEVIKYGAVVDQDFLSWIESNLAALLALDGAALIHAVRRSCQIKAEVVAADEREIGSSGVAELRPHLRPCDRDRPGLRPLAARRGRGLRHGAGGQALGPSRPDRARTRAPAGTHRRERAGLPTKPPEIEPKILVELMRADKKAVEGSQRFVLLEGADGSGSSPRRRRSSSSRCCSNVVRPSRRASRLEAMCHVDLQE